MSKAFPRAERNRLIRLIHAAKRALHLSDEDYRAVLAANTGKASSADMDPAELNRVVEAMRGLGFVPAPGKKKPGTKLSPTTRHKPALAKTQYDKIRALWITAYQVGAVRNRYEQGLNAFCKHMTGVAQLDWVQDPAQLNKITEALKAMIERQGGGPAGDQ